MSRLKYFLTYMLLLLFAPPLIANDEVPEEVVIAYWYNCALYLKNLSEDPPPQDETDALIARMVEVRGVLNLIDWETVKDPDKLLNLLRNGD